MRIPVSLPVEKKSGFVTDCPQLFPPNATTRTLAMTSSELTETGMEVPDLGCGSGIIGLHIAHSLKEQSGGILDLSMSDVSEVATQIASQNAEALGIPAEVRQGWVLEPWQGRKFDLIVADISAVVPVVAKLTNWFNGAPNESGDDGTALATETLSRAGFFLNAGGRMLILVLSVSNESAIIADGSSQLGGCCRTVTEQVQGKARCKSEENGPKNPSRSLNPMKLKRRAWNNMNRVHRLHPTSF